jgi:hypothetical protein
MWMRSELSKFSDEYEDRFAGEFNCTKLAEAAAAHFDKDDEGGWLDDETHWIWEEAVAAAEWTASMRRTEGRR